MKSSYELARERLSKSGPLTKLPDAQKKELAEVDSRYAAKIAEREIFLKEEITKVVDQMDRRASEATKTVRVVRIEGINPTLVQQAIDAIQGRNTSVYRNNSANGFPGANPYPFGPGGFVPISPGFYPPSSFNPPLRGPVGLWP